MKRFFLFTFIALITLTGFLQQCNIQTPHKNFTFSKNIDNITQISLITAENSQVYTKIDDKTWVLETEGGNAVEASAEKIGALLQLLKPVYKARLIEKGPLADERLKAYGLDYNSLIIKIADNNSSGSFILGSYSALGSEIFLLLENSVYAVPAGTLYSLAALH
jgi:hypothetical protein